MLRSIEPLAIKNLVIGQYEANPDMGQVSPISSSLHPFLESFFGPAASHLPPASERNRWADVQVGYLDDRTVPEGSITPTYALAVVCADPRL